MTDRRRFDPFAPPPRPAAGRNPADDEASMSLTGVVQPPAELVSPAVTLPANLDDISKPDLIALAEQHGVATYGTKADIGARLGAL